MAALGDRLGLDPKSRAALKLPAANQRKSKFAGLLGGKQFPEVAESQREVRARHCTEWAEFAAGAMVKTWQGSQAAEAWLNSSHRPSHPPNRSGS
jgi:hypothetical protein